MKAALACFELKWEKLNGISTDGEKHTVGFNTGLVTRIKAEITDYGLDPEELTLIHCVRHQENICTKVHYFKHVIGPVCTCINLVELRVLNHRQF